MPAIAVGVELDERRRGRAARHAHRHALCDARGEQPRDARRDREEGEPDRARHEPAENHGPAADAVGQLAEEQERRREHQRVDREHEREHQAVEAEAIAIDAIQRRCQVRAQQERGERPRDDPLTGTGAESQRHEQEPTSPSLRPLPNDLTPRQPTGEGKPPAR